MAGFVDKLQLILEVLIGAFIIGGSIAWILFRVRLKRIKKQIPKKIIENVKTNKNKHI